MKETYGNSCATYSRSQQSLDLDSISANLSGVANPGSRQLLVQMKSRKKCKFLDVIHLFIQNPLNWRNGSPCIVH